MNTITKLAAAAACGLALAACGGGSDSSGSGGSSSSSSSSSGSPHTFRYEAVNQVRGNLDAFLAQLSAEGARGYRYVGGSGFPGSTVYSWLFVNDGTAPGYTYDLPQDPGDLPDLLTQANTEGAKGYRYEGEITDGTVGYVLYRKDSGSAATYTYVADSVPADAAGWLTQANGRGQSGYWLAGSPIQYGAELSNLYMKNQASHGTYTYHALTQLTSATNRLAQLISEGGQGYRAISYMTGGNGLLLNMLFYMKDQTQSTTFTYRTDTMPATVALFINQANTYGAQGYAANFEFDGLDASFYFQASNCSGFMCTVIMDNVLTSPVIGWL